MHIIIWTGSQYTIWYWLKKKFINFGNDGLQKLNYTFSITTVGLNNGKEIRRYLFITSIALGKHIFILKNWTMFSYKSVKMILGSNSKKLTIKKHLSILMDILIGVVGNLGCWISSWTDDIVLESNKSPSHHWWLIRKIENLNFSLSSYFDKMWLLLAELPSTAFLWNNIFILTLNRSYGQS